MLSLDYVYQHPQDIREALRKRHDERDIDDILRLTEQKRNFSMRIDGLYAALKQLKEQIRVTSVEERPKLNQQAKAISQDIRRLELQNADVDTRLQLQLQSLPNLPHHSVPEGDDQIVKNWGQPGLFHFELLPHWELGERLGIIDAESGAKIAGSRFVTLRGAGARLERALISFMLDIHTREHGYTEVMPPELVKRSIMLGAGQLPKFEEQVYVCSVDELYLNPTAEVPLLGLHWNSILSPGTLPVRYVAWTTAFRREAGSASRLTRGLLRLHQFNKVELFQLVAPEDSYDVLEQMVEHARAILQHLELPHRVVTLGTPNLPFAAAKTIDLEVWMPGLKSYVEVSSISNCESFQAYRSNIKYRASSNSHAQYVHTLNAAGLAIGRTMAAVLETYQQADGSIVIPKVLRPYMGTSLLSPVNN
ncbi:MAG TPA: serine--tRNA ligase [Ktedonobacteraceae bacterium]|nr:serine--tRNA ligase [Ktedonobacteraceae bacterium]